MQRSKMSRISDMGARSTAMNDVAQGWDLNRLHCASECYDISNTVGGAFQVASMVVFEDAIAKKSEYRRFAIRGADGQGCTRRFERIVRDADATIPTWQYRR